MNVLRKQISDLTKHSLDAFTHQLLVVTAPHVVATLELVPNTAWGKNLRNRIPRHEWDKIRAAVAAGQDHRCGICGAEGRFECHEIREYDDVNHIQRLKDFIALCDLCHHVKHLGHASILAAQGKLDMKKVEEHFMRVNGCDLKTFRRHALEAMALYRERSKHEWRLDLGKYERLNKNEEGS